MEEITTIEVSGGNYLKVTLSDGTTLVIRGALVKLKTKLDGEFVPISRDCLLNLRAVKLAHTSQRRINLDLHDGRTLTASRMGSLLLRKLTL